MINKDHIQYDRRSAFQIIAEEHRLMSDAVDEIRDGTRRYPPGIAEELMRAIDKIAENWNQREKK